MTATSSASRSWRRNGLLVTDRAIIMRGGRLTRWASFIPHERPQSLAISHGPLQRALGLTSFQVAGVGGLVMLRARHLEPATVLEAFDTASTLALWAHHQESATQWLERMNLLDAAPAPQPPAPSPHDQVAPPPSPADRAPSPPHE